MSLHELSPQIDWDIQRIREIQAYKFSGLENWRLPEVSTKLYRQFIGFVSLLDRENETIPQDALAARTDIFDTHKGFHSSPRISQRWLGETLLALPYTFPVALASLEATRLLSNEGLKSLAVVSFDRFLKNEALHRFLEETGPRFLSIPRSAMDRVVEASRITATFPRQLGELKAQTPTGCFPDQKTANVFVETLNGTMVEALCNARPFKNPNQRIGENMDPEIRRRNLRELYFPKREDTVKEVLRETIRHCDIVLTFADPEKILPFRKIINQAVHDLKISAKDYISK